MSLFSFIQQELLNIVYRPLILEVRRNPSCDVRQLQLSFSRCKRNQDLSTGEWSGLIPAASRLTEWIWTVGVSCSVLLSSSWRRKGCTHVECAGLWCSLTLMTLYMSLAFVLRTMFPLKLKSPETDTLPPIPVFVLLCCLRSLLSNTRDTCDTVCNLSRAGSRCGVSSDAVVTPQLLQWQLGNWLGSCFDTALVGQYWWATETRAEQQPQMENEDRVPTAIRPGQPSRNQRTPPSLVQDCQHHR